MFHFTGERAVFCPLPPVQGFEAEDRCCKEVPMGTDTFFGCDDGYATISIRLPSGSATQLS